MGTAEEALLTEEGFGDGKRREWDKNRWVIRVYADFNTPTQNINVTSMRVFQPHEQKTSLLQVLRPRHGAYKPASAVYFRCWGSGMATCKAILVHVCLLGPVFHHVPDAHKYIASPAGRLCP